MKKIVKMLLLAAIFTLALSISAFAAGEKAGFCDLTSESGVTLEAQDEDGNAAPLEDGVYVDAVRMEVTFSKAVANKYYLVVALDDDEKIPTVGDDGKNNVAYINQVTADETTVVFDVYPKDLVNGQVYHIYVSSNDDVNTYKEVASFKYYAPYKMGDVNESGEADSDDALLILRYAVNLTNLTDKQLIIANVKKDAAVDSDDALKILRYAVNLIDSLDE